MNFKKTRNKEKTNKNSEESIQSFRSWIRKLEQSTNSLGSRLSAVEKRISNKKIENTKEIQENDKKITKIFKKIKKDQDITENLEEIGTVLDEELIDIREEIIQQQIEIKEINKKLKDIDLSIKHITEEIEKSKNINNSLSENMEYRLEKIEKKEPLSFKFGKMEIPIEITGLIGGTIAIIIAVLVSIGYKEILISPIFLTLIGVILISSTLLKTLNLLNFLNKPFKKSSDITKSIEETQ